MSGLPDGLAGWRPRPYTAPSWLRGPHLQTVGGRLLRPRPDLPLRREVVGTPDGDELVLDFGPDPSRDGPVVLVLHGLEGSSRRRYALRLQSELVRRGMAPVGFNFRGCARPNRTARAYHSGDTDDPALVLRRLRERFQGRPLGAVGVSLGGNVLLKLLAEGGPGERGGVPDAAVAVSVPYDLAAGARALEGSAMGRAYARYFLASLTAKVRGKRDLLEEAVDVEAVLRSRTIRDFDDRLTAPLHGFRDAEDYYRRSSSGPLLGRIRTPTLLVHARDDPFLPWDRVPAAAARDNPHLLTAFTERGGHVGFVEGPPWSPGFWAESVAADFLSAALGAGGP